MYYAPPRASRPQSGSNGTLQDGDAQSYWRPYHRVVVPANATSSSNGNGNWWVAGGSESGSGSGSGTSGSESGSGSGGLQFVDPAKV